MSTLTETEERYEVWVEDQHGRRPVAGGGSWPAKNLEFVEGLTREYNDEEVGNARMEMRDVRARFFMVSVTLTRREVGV
jgi:hypothetical protein